MYFKKWLNENDQFNEIFGRFSYKVPEDKEKQLYDFYMLSYLKGLSQYDVQRNSFRDKTGYDIKQFSVIRPDHTEMDHEDKIDYMLKEVSDTLLPTLKSNMLSAVFFSLCAEFRHVFDRNNPQELLKIAKNLGEQYYAGFKNYAKRLALYRDPIAKTMTRIPRPDHPDITNNNTGYYQSYSSAIKSGLNKSQFVYMMKVFYDEVKWVHMYGGKAWSQICIGWTKLDEAKKERDMTVWIDHVYDLQHNTSTVFNKVQSYAKNGSYEWLKKALDHKAQIKDPHEIIDKVSFPMKQLSMRAIKLKTGKSYEQFLKEKPDKEGEFQVIDPNKPLDYNIDNSDDIKDDLKTSLKEEYNRLDGSHNLKLARILLKINNYNASNYIDTIFYNKTLTQQLNVIEKIFKKNFDHKNISVIFNNERKIAEYLGESKISTIGFYTGTSNILQMMKDPVEKGKLEDIVKEISKNTSDDFPFINEDTKKSINDLLFTQNLSIPAIKLFREKTNYELKSAKAYILFLYARKLLNKKEEKLASDGYISDLAKKQLHDSILHQFKRLEGDRELKIARILLGSEPYFRAYLNIDEDEELTDDRLYEIYEKVMDHQSSEKIKILELLKQERKYQKLLSHSNILKVESFSKLKEMSYIELSKLIQVNNIEPYITNDTKKEISDLLLDKGMLSIKLFHERTNYGYKSAKAYAMIAYAKILLDNKSPQDTQNIVQKINSFDGNWNVQWARYIISQHGENKIDIIYTINQLIEKTGITEIKYIYGQILQIQNSYNYELAELKRYSSMNVPDILTLNKYNLNQLQDLNKKLGDFSVILNAKTLNEAENIILNGYLHQTNILLAVKLFREKLGWGIKASKNLVNHLAVKVILDYMNKHQS